jgi:hypothetical protein
VVPDVENQRELGTERRVDDALAVAVRTIR